MSDVAPFASAVAGGGGLPFLALALMRGPEVKRLLTETARLLGDRSWGVGILGFVPLELRKEQLEAIREARPPYALIAGGRPDQARQLEKEGIATYLHVPSPGLLEMFLNDGARRFVFEGRECGGHVGPRTSFVLWQTMVDVLLEQVAPSEFETLHVVFAGGIHDARSASMVAALAAPLARAGAKIGVLLGTAYLFTEEAVSTGAIQPGFQDEADRCSRTVLLETGPGHATRCVDTAFAREFESERRRLRQEQRPPEEVRDLLEQLNLGRLRIASKGILREGGGNGSAEGPSYRNADDAEQRQRGMYMIGQVAELRHGLTNIAALHQSVSDEAMTRLRDLRIESVPDPAPSPSDVAIVGIGCILPQAADTATFWENILAKRDAITEIPPDRWDWRKYFDEDPKARDKVYSRWGGFIGEIPFDPLRYGMPPSSLGSIEPAQILALEVTRQALSDAGYADREFNREKTSVIFGAGGGVADLGAGYVMRSHLPMMLDHVPEEILERLPEWTEDSFAGILPNVIAGRVANRFDFGGVNFTVDAACASSLAAIYQSVRELETGSSDLVIAGGVDTLQNPFTYLCFAKTQALSPRGRCRTFDADADGIVISEGLVAMVLKRLSDAERDGDRIYGVIKAVAGSSDGRDRGLTAPRPEGQMRALERAYAKAGFSPATVELFETHGTGTVAGDQAEAESLSRVLGAHGAAPASSAVGSVKSMIGHTKCSAGVAGLAKIALALRNQILPPTLNVEKPNPKSGFGTGPLYVNTETRPWLKNPDHPRRAGVSSFGFGGTNFHVVLEEYTGNFTDAAARTARQWPCELFLWTAENRESLITQIEALSRNLEAGAEPDLAGLAHSVSRARRARLSAGNGRAGGGLTLSVIAESIADLREKISRAAAHLHIEDGGALRDPRGIYFNDRPLAGEGRVAFLFPGQGSQAPGMGADLSLYFPEVRETYERADAALAGKLGGSLG
ncbi:MAG: beta-ketoacyl synthase N-terminal-like domain-containing protein, partial [Deltaproteobacteria bacterium]|nr:beta-ketoacyl synthase N-terminal-like domain-containing protein [Deltaproteobacteria bacterium]